MAFAHAGFVLLSMPKAGSTALQRQFGEHAHILIRHSPSLKHVPARTFERVFAPWFHNAGFPRETYETMCLVRDPVDRAVSWWKYRGRPDLRGKPNYTGDLSFAEFADRLITGAIPLGTATSFVSNKHGTVLVDRLYRYENIAGASAWMAERLGIPNPTLPAVNVSRRRKVDLDAAGRARLDEFFAADLALYESAR